VKLLIVDDNPKQLDVLGIVLKTKGHSVMTARNGEEALRRLDEDASQIELVLTDDNMPDMNGLDLLRRIGNKRVSLPVILMSACGDKQLVMNALRGGCNGFVDKPFTIDSLASEIERVKTMANQNFNPKEFFEKLPELINSANDKLTVIAGNAEIALMDIDRRELEPIKNQLRTITALSDEIGIINGKIMGMIDNCYSQSEAV
jgi:DNA-binding NtrC family response regulator